jgi:hypothetical protein
MTQRSLFWDTSGLGDGGPYTQTDLHDNFFRSIINGTGDRAVVKGWRSELLVSGSSSPLSIATGGGCVYGMLYDMDEATTVSVPTPSSGASRYDIICLRRDWAAQTVRVYRHSGVAAGSPVVPTLTQTAGTYWEAPLATVLIDDAGTITLTDTREFCAFSTEWPANIVEAGMYEQGAITAALRPDRTRYILKGAGQITADSTNPCTRVAGGSYDYWQFAPAVTNEAWVYFQIPQGVVGSQVTFYFWSTPDVNGAGAGAENCRWTYSIWHGPSGGALANDALFVDADQQLRLNTTAYADQVPAVALGGNEGDIIAFQLGRNGGADSYASNMRLHGVEMRWTAEA